jgi:hypothetical protein
MTNFLKKVCLLLAAMVLINNSSVAKKIKGKIVLADKTIDVTLEIPLKMFGKKPNLRKLQKSVSYYDSNGQKVKVKAKDAKEISFVFDTISIRMVSLTNLSVIGVTTAASDYLFLKLDVEGKLNMYSYYYIKMPMVNSPQSLGPAYGNIGWHTGAKAAKKHIFQKGNGELRLPNSLTFKNDMLDYFSDCSELYNKIEKREFKKESMMQIALFYNANCGK